MNRNRKGAVGRNAGSFGADEIRRNLGRRAGLALVAAGLIVAMEVAVLQPPGNLQKQIQATPEPAIGAPAFVRPPRPSPDVLMGGRIRIG